MDRQRTVAGPDVHKNSIYLCVMGHYEAILFQHIYGTLTSDLRQMCADMVFHGVKEAPKEITATYWVPVWNVLYDRMSLK